MHELVFTLSFSGDSYITEYDDEGVEVWRKNADFEAVRSYFQMLYNQPYEVRKNIDTITKLEELADNED